MKCSSCGHPLELQKKFCGECGAPAPGGSGNTASTGGGDVHGSLYQAGRDVVVNPPPDVPPSATYEAVPKWRSPFTQGVLSWAGAIIGLVSLFPLGKFLQAVLGLFTSGPEGVSGSPSLAWLVASLVLVLVVVLIIKLRRVTKAQLRVPLMFGWAVSGSGHRITIEKIRAGKCPLCGGKMRYYSKPTEWIDHIDANGRKRREVTERRPALECTRNPRHWVEVDPAEEE